MWFVILIKRETFSSEVAFRDGRTVKLIRPLTTGQKILENFKILGQENSHSMIFKNLAENPFLMNYIKMYAT